MNWDMPEVQLGDTVIYRAHADAAGEMAFVSKLGKDALTLWVLSPGYGGSDKTSVRHKDDPRLDDSAEWRKFGTWEHKKRDPRIAQLSERLSALEKSVQGNKK
jgi:hypothetical protein